MQGRGLPAFSILIPVTIFSLFLPYSTLADNYPLETSQASTGSRRLAIIDPVSGQAISGEKAILNNRKSPGLTAELENFKDQMRALMELNLTGSGLEEKVMANGAVKVDLKGRFRIPLMAVPNNDGERGETGGVSITHHYISIQHNH